MKITDHHPPVKVTTPQQTKGLCQIGSKVGEPSCRSGAVHLPVLLGLEKREQESA